MNIMALLFLATTRLTSIVPSESLPLPDFAMRIMGIETPIYCGSNNTNIAVYKEMRAEVTDRLAPLERASLDDTISEEQVHQLFDARSEQAALSHIVATYEMAAYYCEHKDKLPKPK